MKKIILILASLLQFPLFAFDGEINDINKFVFQRENLPKLNNAMTGRYLYFGDVPKFEDKDLELHVSKLGLTLRVKAWVTQDKINNYSKFLKSRVQKIEEATQSQSFSFLPLIAPEKMKKNAPKEWVNWLTIYAQYNKHSLESIDPNITYESAKVAGFDAKTYKTQVVNAIKTSYFSAESIDENNIVQSENLFLKHLDQNFTKSNEKEGYVGYLTFVYPIAGLTDGPHAGIKEQVVTLKTDQSMNARFWSEKWMDLFGGFPFLLLQYTGEAIHGPVSVVEELNTWYLRRDYVSHGCFRMNESDILEVRAMMPAKLISSKHKIKVFIYEYFDLLTKADGTKNVVDVEYYNMPTEAPYKFKKNVDEYLLRYSVANQKNTYFANHPYAKKYYNKLTDSFVGIPTYKLNNDKVMLDSAKVNAGITRFSKRPVSIIQYREDKVKKDGFDDTNGQFPPRFFEYL